VDNQPRSEVPKKKRRRDRLIRLAGENPHTWVVGFEDECWWSRLARPNMHSFSQEGEPLRLVEQSVAKDDPDPKAICCYGLYVPEFDQTWVRFVDGRPVSAITTRFLSWCSQKLEAMGKRVWVLIWDNASWHISQEVSRWIDSHNKEVKRNGRGVRIISSLLPIKSPWLNAMEPKWILTANEEWCKPMACSRPTSWPIACAPPLSVHITSIYPLPKKPLDHALRTNRLRPSASWREYERLREEAEERGAGMWGACPDIEP
jgi:hypothetical protein